MPDAEVARFVEAWLLAEASSLPSRCSLEGHAIQLLAARSGSWVQRLVDVALRGARIQTQLNQSAHRP
eukprot:6967273-Prymnesium_polylepis.1